MNAKSATNPQVPQATLRTHCDAQRTLLHPTPSTIFSSSRILHPTPLILLTLADGARSSLCRNQKCRGCPHSSLGPPYHGWPSSQLSTTAPESLRLQPSSTWSPCSPDQSFSKLFLNSKLILGLPFPTPTSGFRIISKLPSLAPGRTFEYGFHLSFSPLSLPAPNPDSL